MLFRVLACVGLVPSDPCAWPVPCLQLQRFFVPRSVSYRPLCYYRCGMHYRTSVLLCQLKLVLLASKRCWILHQRLRMTHFVTGYVCRALGHRLATVCMIVIPLRSVSTVCVGRYLTPCGRMSRIGFELSLGRFSPWAMGGRPVQTPSRFVWAPGMGWGSGSGKAEVLNQAVGDPIVAFSSSDDHPFNGKLVFGKKAVTDEIDHLGEAAFPIRFPWRRTMRQK